MDSSDVYRLLVCRIRRGMIIFPALWLVSIVVEFTQFFLPGGRPWGVAAFLAILASVCFKFFYSHVRERNASAWNVAANPHLVYRAHPMNWGPRLAMFKFGNWPGEFLTLYLRDGTEFEVGLPLPEMRSFVKWLSERNPSVQWDSFDDVDPINRHTPE